MSTYEIREMQRKADAYDNENYLGRLIIKGVVITLLTVIALIFAWKALTPQLNLYKAETEKKAVIAEQRAASEAAEFAAKSEVIQAQAKADAEVIRAQGLADAQKIISSTLTEEYLRYLYIQQLDENPGQVIYVPTEAGLPILEATRGAEVGDNG